MEKQLRILGFTENGGTKHAKWTDGQTTVTVPRHKEINELTAKGILKDAQLAAKARGTK